MRTVTVVISHPKRPYRERIEVIAGPQVRLGDFLDVVRANISVFARNQRVTPESVRWVIQHPLP